jgi:hypothetical protein
MQYRGKLYGKFAGKYIPLTPTTEDIDKMDNLDRLSAKLNEANAIIKAALNELPVGHIPTHTPDSIPERVKHYVRECARMEEELNKANVKIEIMTNALQLIADEKRDKWYALAILQQFIKQENKTNETTASN